MDMFANVRTGFVEAAILEHKPFLSARGKRVASRIDTGMVFVNHPANRRRRWTNILT